SFIAVFHFRFVIPPPPQPTLFPYTTLFRSNTYTASLYFALTAQLHNNEDLAGKRLGFFSYGSGAVAEFFTGVVQENYRDHIYPRSEEHTSELQSRFDLVCRLLLENKKTY